MPYPLQYASALMFYPWGKKSVKRIPFLSPLCPKKLLFAIFATEHVCLNFHGFFLGERTL
jgi:hypothetical protein